MASQRIDVDYPGPISYLRLPGGEDVAYLQLGNGPITLVLVHGLASYIPVWQRNLAGLAQVATVVAIDLPGYGHSTLAGHPPSLVYYADVIAKTIRYLALRNVVLVGHSMGGQISTIFSLRYPWLLDRLVLIAPAGFEVYSEQDKQAILKQFESFPVSSVILLRYFNRALTHNPLGSVPEAQRAHVLVEAETPKYARTLARSIIAMLNEPIYPYLTQLKPPTLVIFGDDDGLIPNRLLQKGQTTRQVAQTACSLIPKCRLSIIPGGGHFVQYEYPLVVNDQIEQFAGIS